MPDAVPVEILNLSGVTVVRPGASLGNLFEAQLEHLSVVTTLADSITPARLVVDLNNIKMVGSAFLGRMVAIHKKLSARDNGRLALCNLNSFCTTALSVSKLDTVLTVHPSLDDAIDAMKP